MMKSHLSEVLSVAAGILKDVRQAYCDQTVELDYKSLTRIVEDRGLGVFTLDLPSRDDQLLIGLSTGLLPSTGYQKYSKKYPVPRLFAGLYMRIFDKALCLKDNADPTAVFFLRQLLCLGKKLQIPCSKKRELQAIKEYVHVEQILPSPTYSWDHDTLNIDDPNLSVHLCDRLDFDLPLLSDTVCPDTRRRVNVLLSRSQQVADFLCRSFGFCIPEREIIEREHRAESLGLKHGPGAVAERTGTYDKYEFRSWPLKLRNVFPITFGKMPNDIERKFDIHEAPSRVCLVPKTAKGPRIIAAEPSQHMWCQQLLLQWFVDRFENTMCKHFISLNDQRPSGEMALQASLDQSMATVDLSSASDRLSCWVVERIFRSNPSILTALHASRTRWSVLPTGEYIKLKKFASQGTAVTFPVQTFVFLCLALGASLGKGEVNPRSIRKLVSRVRVFGDDIIIPNTRYADLDLLLHTLKLKVNSKKSFHTGYFRESCGVDGFKGYDVTPCKPKSLWSYGPTSCLTMLDTANNLFTKGLWNASNTIKSRLDSDSRTRFGIVGPDVGSTGHYSPSFNCWAREHLPQFSNDVYNCVVSSIRKSGEDHSYSFVHGGILHGIQRKYIPTILARALQLGRIRWNSTLHTIEVQRRSITSVLGRGTEFLCGYSGLLDWATRPAPTKPLICGRRSPALQPILVGDHRGVPGKSRIRNSTRWEPLGNLFS